MKKLTFTTLIIMALSFSLNNLCAETMTINTPDGSVTIDVNDNTSRNRGYTSSGTIINNINNKLDRLERDFISKLSRRERKNAELILDDIFSLLRMLPNNSNVTITQSNTNSNYNNNNNGSVTMSINDNTGQNGGGSATISFNQGGANININENSNSNSHTSTSTSTSTTTVVTNTAMSPSNFESFYQNMQNESFDDGKMSTLEVNTKHNYYNIDQVTRVIKLFSFSDSKLNALRIMYKKVVDKNNSQQVLQSFEFENDKKKAKNIMNN